MIHVTKKYNHDSGDNGSGDNDSGDDDDDDDDDDDGSGAVCGGDDGSGSPACRRYQKDNKKTS